MNIFPLLIAMSSSIGLLQYHGFIDNPAVAQCIENYVDENGEPASYVRLCSCACSATQTIFVLLSPSDLPSAHTTSLNGPAS